jgi:hypothetical protein
MAQDQLLTLWARFRRWRWWWQALVWFAFPPAPVAVWAASQRQGRAMAWGLVVLVTGAWYTIGAQPDRTDTAEASAERSSAATAASAPTTEPPSTRATPQPAGATTGPPTTASATPAPAPATQPPSIDLSIIDRLVIAPEGSNAGYDRDLFDHWIDADSDGCDTRCEVLEQERRTDLAGLPEGGWLSIYDGYTTPDPGELEIDHVVALAEAWRSGASSWDAARRAAFANDLNDFRALAAVSASTNRSKGDRDPATWRPPSGEAWCWYADAWAMTKVRWGLSADHAEVESLRVMLPSC